MLKLALVLIFFSNLVAQDEFVFSYRAFVQNSIISDEKFNISPAMLTQDEYSKSICNIKSRYQPSLSKIEFLYQNKEKLLECFLTGNRHVVSFSDSSDLVTSTTTILSIAPTKLKVNLKDNLAIISSF